MNLSELLNHRLLIVTGKGGVGKTTLSLALALLAQKQGKKTIVAEIHSEEQVARLLEKPDVGYAEKQILPGISGINIDPKKAFKEYVLMQIHFRRLYHAVFENRFVSYFIEAIPGLSDLMSIGKVSSLVKDYDLVIVDAPATGHGLALLETPSIVARAVRVGPLKTEAEKIDALLHDPLRTGIVIVTLPEEMPVMEAVEMKQTLAAKLGLETGVIFLNQVQDQAFTPSEKRELEKLKKTRGEEDPICKAIDLQRARADMSEKYRIRISELVEDRPIVSLPFLSSPDFGLPEVQRLAEAVERRMP